jgi:hypothetical protein
MVKYFREDLHRKLLSPDFKKQIDGLELLQKAILFRSRRLLRFWTLYSAGVLFASLNQTQRVF